MQQRRTLLQQSRRPTMAVLLSAALVFAAALGGNQIMKTQATGTGPIAVDEASTSFADGANVVVEDAAINAQGGSGERTVKEFTRDEPFSMFAITWDGDRDIAAYVRAEAADGSWGQWYPLETLTESAVGAKNGTELIYVEPTTKVQVSVANVDLVDPAPAPVEEAPAPAPTPAEETPAPAPAPAATVPGAATPAPAPVNYSAIKPVADEVSTTTTAADLQAVFIDGNAQEGGIGLTAESDTYGMPDVITRASWGADESVRCSRPTIDDELRGLVIHHTAGSNNYTEAQAAAQVRGIYQYHAVTLGWCDIGYNALVDKYGNIYEGRAGGLTNNVQGAHAGGFNTGTWGISMIGDYSTVSPSQATIQSVGEIAGWRAAVAGIDPEGRSTFTSGGTSYSKYAAGTQVTLPNIFAHRDVGTTTCPGDAGYAQMDTIRAIAARTYNQIESGGTATDPTPQSTSTTTTTATATATSTAVTPAQPSNGTPAAEPAGSSNADISALITAIASGDREKLAAAAGTIALGAISMAAANGEVSGSSQLGDTEVVAGLTIADIPVLIGQLVEISGNSEIEQHWNNLTRVLGPVLGGARSGVQTTYSPAAGTTNYAVFDEGIILNNAATGTNALWGKIAQAWAGQGFDLGKLGLPINEEYQWQGVLRVDFQGGYITYDPATGKVDIQLG